ncbi:MAG: protein translocase subunit SecD [Lachnospiraceae bacterium]|nr:protein translocase subunit SecD [Lachnospiraceae bacterium]
MKKSSAALLLALVLAIMVGFGYIMVNGVDERGSGAIKNTKLGLDLAGGVSITYQAAGDTNPTPTEISDTIEKLRKRVEKYSTEAGVYQEGDNRISIEIPGVKDAEAVLADLGSPGQLYFIRAMGPDGILNYGYRNYLDMPVYSEKDTYFVFSDADGGFLYDDKTSEIVVDADGNPVMYKIKDVSSINREYILTKPLEQIIAEGSAVLSGTDVAKSEGGAFTDKNDKQEFLVQLKFTEEGAKIFAEETAAVVSKTGLPGTIGIYYDGKLISVPNVQTAITGGEGQISGMGSYEEADKLAQSIRIGGLSLELEELRSNVVGAQLGADAISTSILAGLIGVGIIMIFMVIVYRIPGLVASIALVAYTMMMMLCVNFLGITMTLPGIAGIILSIGMAVDANVIIFARIREELAIGMTVESSIKSGFNKALSAIIDGNITTLIAAVVLMAIGSGTIKGFAYTLALGIVLSMITALFVTKLLLNCFFALGFKDAKWIGKVKEVKTINFLGKNKVYFGVSGAIIAVGIIVMVIMGITTGDPLNYSLDFKGGTATTVDFETLQTAEYIDGTIVADIEKITGDANVLWTTVNNTNQVIFKTREFTEDEREEFKQLMMTKYGVQDQKISVETISSTISGEMLKSAIMAVIVAAGCMLIYIWLRFSDFRFGASAVAALVHDVFVVITFYACVRLSVGSTFIACILTIVGYSINATIVVFDRIRENLRADRKKRTFSIEDTVNKSITQTLTRSIFTSLTTFITVAVLYILGVSSIKEFALPLMIGIVSGTYSSVCLTGAMWNLLRNKFPQTEEDDD